MERTGLINLVKIKLDEYTPEGVSLPFDDYIGPMLDESSKDIQEKGPIHLLTSTELPCDDIIFQNNKAYIPVPADYIRIQEIKFPLWKKSVRVAISTENPNYTIQDNEFLAAGYARPIVTVLSTNIVDGLKKYLECAKVLDNTTPSVASYIKKLKPEEMPDILAESISWLCASKILHIGGQADKARLAYEQFANSLIII